ncbi:sperm-egg fusion protein TMEM95 [Spea bombifrons]|uniref:sperm-egg fusion protein TMEM95 n=1 Tax=Spea bombifrons TaxID=233779 RepID=UPI00234A841D|nr:sperm-egg fusion protein TMEM95 [Spea bombifrons]
MSPRHLLLLLLLLPLLPAGSGCVFCRLGYLEIRQRFHKLCEDYMRAQGSENCTRHPGPSSFNQFAIDDETLLFVTEKTHRVFRFLEIKRDVLGIAEYWDWLHEVKLPELTYEVDWTYAYNCTLCRVKSMKCFDKETCFPGETLCSTGEALFQGGGSVQ